MSDFLRLFVGEECKCPFCNIKLTRFRSDTMACIQEKNYCPYFTTLRFVVGRGVPDQDPDQEILNTMEIILPDSDFSGRIWISDVKEIKKFKIGEHRHINCILLPYSFADLSDVENFTIKMKKIFNETNLNLEET